MTPTCNVAALRKAATPPLTQKQLAELVGVDQTYISLIEAGKRTPSNDITVRLAKALGIAPSELQFASPEPGETIAKDNDRAGHTVASSEAGAR